ncbi:MAG: peptide chain release factor N(5)-glutamine methyltransferase [Spirochaetales bacterium]|nr:peptide chain release factor N(5)-glutamine methyltransferase [Spirochaetales bacterium]
MDRKTDNRFRSVLRAATDRLRACLADAPAGSGETPYLDALVLLAHAASMTSEQLFAAFEDQVPDPVLAEYQSFVSDRCDGAPVSYIRRVKEFFGRDFLVGPGVLVPRPDTEMLVESALDEIDRLRGGSPHVHDCCTGSGCVAITIARERDCTVTASDSSEEALSYARSNAVALDATSVAFWNGDLLAPLRTRIAGGQTTGPAIITANPPYVADNEVDHLIERGWPEPALALAGGQDGLLFIGRLIREAAACLPDGGCLMVEIGADQGPATVRLFEEAGFGEVSLIRDLGDRDRVCNGRWYRR